MEARKRTSISVELGPTSAMTSSVPANFLFDWKNSSASVKNTFIHVDDGELEWWDPTHPLRRTASCPGLLQAPVEAEKESSEAFRLEPVLPKASFPWEDSTDAGERSASKDSNDSTPRASMLERNLLLHQLGNCKPCSYYYFKDDGCRNGDSCEFCHFCSPAAVKENKRRLKRDARRERRQAHLEAAREAVQDISPDLRRAGSRARTASSANVLP